MSENKHKRIALIACSKSKLGKDNLERKYKAKDIYTGFTFILAKTEGIKRFDLDDYYIISAKHHLLDKDDEITYYDKTLNKMNKKEQREWAKIVLQQLKDKFDLEHDEFYIFGGTKYYKNLIPHLNCTVFAYFNCKKINLDKPTTYKNGGK